MKAEELMIGDWVCDGSINIQVTPENIFDIYVGNWDEPKPIPLTEEILKKNGFILKGKTHECNYDSYFKRYVDKYNNAYELNFTPSNGCFELFGKNRMYGIKYVKYVHEVQHALRLCDLNELADSFKIETDK